MANHIFKKKEESEKANLGDLFHFFSTEVSSRLGDDKKLSDNTIQNYVNRLNKVSKIITKKDWSGNDKFLYDFEDVQEKLKATNLKALKDYISPIVKYLRQKGADNNLILKYQGLLAEFKNKETKQRGENKATKKQEENSMAMDEINKKIDDFEPKTNTELLYKLLMVLYFQNDEFTPRLEDIPLMKLANAKKKVGDLNKDYNYILTTGEQGKLKAKEIVMNNYKTKQTYGAVRFPIPPNVQEILNEYFKAFSKANGDYLILNTKQEPYLIQTFSHLLNNSSEKILGKSMNPNLIRRIKITDFLRRGPHSINDEEKEAKKYLHSKEVAREYLSLNLE